MPTRTTRTALIGFLGAAAALRDALLTPDDDAVAHARAVALDLERQAPPERAQDLRIELRSFLEAPATSGLDRLVAECRRLFAVGGGRTGVVVVDPDPDRRRTLLEAAMDLAEPFLEASDADEAIRVLLQRHAEVGLVIASRGDHRDLDVVRAVLREPLLDQVPVVVVARPSVAAWTTATLAGACEVIAPETLALHALPAVISAYLGYEERSALELFLDPLTGALPEDEFLAAVHRAAEDYTLFRRGPCSILMLEVTNLDILRREVGSRGAERAVVQTIEQMRTVLPLDAEFARLEEGRLAALLPGVQLAALDPMIATLRASLASLPALGGPTSRYRALVRGVAFEAGSASGSHAVQACRDALAASTGIEPPRLLAAHRRSCVLVVEDDPVVLGLVRSLLEREGMQVIGCTNGEDAVAVAGTPPEGGFSLAILDLDLPGYSGFHVLDFLKGQPATKGTPVLMLTGTARDQYMVSALERGAADYLLKPLRSSVFLARVRAALRTQR